MASNRFNEDYYLSEGEYEEEEAAAAASDANNNHLIDFYAPSPDAEEQEEELNMYDVAEDHDALMDDYDDDGGEYDDDDDEGEEEYDDDDDDQEEEGGGEYDDDEQEEEEEEANWMEINGGEREQTEEIDGDNVDFDRSANCTICFKPWTANGPHRVCCLPCGHVHGKSCLVTWLQRRGETNGKCPQCNRQCRQSEIINLYLPTTVVPNGSLDKTPLLEPSSQQRKREISGWRRYPSSTPQEETHGRAHCSGLDERVSDIEVKVSIFESLEINSRLSDLQKKVTEVRGEMTSVADVCDVAEVKVEIAELRNDVAQVEELQNEVYHLRSKMAEMRREMAETAQVGELQNEIYQLKSKMAEMRREMAETRRMFAEMRRFRDEMHVRKKRR